MPSELTERVQAQSTVWHCWVELSLHEAELALALSHRIMQWIVFVPEEGIFMSALAAVVQWFWVVGQVVHGGIVHLWQQPPLSCVNFLLPAVAAWSISGCWADFAFYLFFAATVVAPCVVRKGNTQLVLLECLYQKVQFAQVATTHWTALRCCCIWW